MISIRTEKFCNEDRANIVRYLRNKRIPIDDAEDIASAAIVHFCKNFDESKGFHPKTLLYHCVEQHLRYYRQRPGQPYAKSAKGRAEVYPFVDVAAHLIEDKDVIENGFHLVEAQEEMEKVLGVLMPSLDTQEQVFVNLVLNEMPKGDIAREMKISRSRIRQIKDKVLIKAARAVREFAV